MFDRTEVPKFHTSSALAYRDRCVEYLRVHNAHDGSFVDRLRPGKDLPDRARCAFSRVRRCMPLYNVVTQCLRLELSIPEMRRLEQVFSLFMRQLILPFSRSFTGESRVPPDQHETLQGGWGFTDPSGPLFSMYLDRAEEKDKKMTDRWKADADGILIFVSSHISCLFSRQLRIYRPVCFQLWLRRLLESPSRTSSRIPRIPPHFILQISIRYCRRQRDRPSGASHPSPILPNFFRYLGQLPLVLELSHGSHMCSAGHLIATVGTSLPLGESPSMYSPQTIKAPLVLCRRRQQVTTPVGY
jgi:hypothetical protein